jgi:rSAM/selenodomain-associated transferase 1
LDVAENNPVNQGAAGLWQQEGADIGERMSNALEKILELGYSAAVLVGADIWGIECGDFKDAFGLLENKDVVFGPARDGGYYLVGLKIPHPELFRLAEWSHDRVLSDSLEICKRENFTVGLIRKLKDIDYAADLEGTDL